MIDFYAAQGAVPIPGVPKFDSTRVLDGQRKMVFYKPIPPTSAGKTFELRSKVTGVWDKGKSGTVLDTQQDIVDKVTGEVYTSISGSAFFVGQGNWGGPKGPATEAYPPPAGKKPDAIVEHQTTKESALLYRYVFLICPRRPKTNRIRLNGDYNPLHATPEPGQKMGFGGAIMQYAFFPYRNPIL